MIASAARIAANRRNALKSTGPRTAEGKEIARRNALKHGLTAATIPPPDEGGAAFEERAASFRRTLQPASDYHAWLVNEIAAATLRLDRARRMERQLRDGASWRALTCWDDDRRLDAERIGAALDRRPAAVVAELRATPQGIDWLIARWDVLADAASRHPWTADQSRLAAHLLGTPPEADPDAILTENGESAESLPPDPAESDLAGAMMAELRDLRDRMAEADDVARATVAAGLADMGQPDLARLRRYERDLQRRLRWCHDRLHAEPAGRPATPVAPHPAAPAAPAAPTGIILPAPASPVAAGEANAAGRDEPIPPLAPAETKPPAPAPAPRFDLDDEVDDEAEARAWVASLEGMTPDQKQRATLAAAHNLLGRLDDLDRRLARHQRRPDLGKALARAGRR